MELAVELAVGSLSGVVFGDLGVPRTSLSDLGVSLAASYLVHCVGGILFYLASAGLSFLYFFHLRKELFYPDTLPKDFSLKKQVINEISYAIWSIPIMAVLLSPFPLLLINGYGMVYERVEDYGWAYLFFSMFFFLFFTDGCIYFIHRALHHPMLYKRIHKPHHRYKYTTPFSSHSFHPLDGFGQGIPYYIFALLFPIQKQVFSFMFVIVNLWTVSIHDQVDFFGGGILNSTGHHTIHHELFIYNYGQYFTLWDRLFGTYKPSTKTNEFFTGKKLQESKLKNDNKKLS